jgi:serine/threonine protein kinase
MGDEHLITLQPGTVIAGRYEVVKCLGAGNMGLVYACRHRELAGHMVAIKVLFPEVAQDKIAAQRFRNEIFAAYGVSHPNVVRAYEYLRDGDLVAYTMEYVGGGDLADRLEIAEPIPVLEVVGILCQICSGVQAIHDAGIVHRDLKPENILLTKDGVVKIADFGIARVGRGSKLTEHGGVVGTIDYVSPEYMLNSQVDWRSDIYAIGILGYEMLTGKSPFRGDSVYATMTKRLKSDPALPSSLREDVPRDLDAVVLKAMDRDPGRRFQSAAEMFCELRKLLPDQNTLSMGAILQFSQRQSNAYVGPSWNGAGSEETESGTGEFEQPQEESYDYMPVDAPITHTLSSEPARPAAAPPEMEATVQFQGYGVNGTVIAGPSVIPSQSRAAHAPQPETIEISSQYHLEETVYKPNRMESVLGYKDMVSGSWNGDSEATHVIMNSISLNDNRVRRLSQIVDKVERSVWVEVLTLVFAIMIGVGVGFAFVRMFFPDLVAREKSEVSMPASDAHE